MANEMLNNGDMPARVTVVGLGRSHLKARERVLRHFWQINLVAVDEGEELSLETELVVVCHTLPEKERQGWVERVRADAPTMLVVKMNDHECGPHAGADATVDESHGPGALVSAIYELLTERGLASRSWPDNGAGVLLH